MIIKYKRSKWPHALLGLLLITLIAAVGLTRAQTSTVSGGGIQDSKIPTESDENGIYHWNWTPDDKLRFTFRKDGFLLDFLGPEKWFTAQSEPYEVVLHHQKTFRGSVVDAETKKPVKEFKIVYGTEMNNRPDIDNYAWQTPQEQTFSGIETFQYIPLFQYDKYWLRFTAEGYEPFVAGPYSLDAEPPVLNIALKQKSPGSMLSGTALLPSGKPAAGAKILLTKEREYVQFILPGMLDPWGRPLESIIKADTQGRFRFYPPADGRDYRLYVAHADGFAQMDKADVKNEMTIPLQKYARLEIKIPYDTKPDACNRYGLNLSSENTARFEENKKPIATSPKMIGIPVYQGSIPQDGNIVIDSVAPGRYNFMEYAGDKLRRYNITQFPVEILPGETKSWDLTAPNGVKLTARIALPRDYEGEFTAEDWNVCSFTYTALLDEGKQRKTYLGKIRPSQENPREGVVEIDRVVPGKGNWHVMLYKYNKPEKNTPYIAPQESFLFYGSHSKMTTIPEPTGNEPKDRVFDLGTIVVLRFKPSETKPVIQ